MKTKLTLSIDEELVSFAHQEARRESRSVSEMVTAYLRRRQQKSLQAKVPTTASLVGSLKDYRIDDSKEGIAQAYAEKYLH